MITTTNTENFQQYESGFSLIVEQVLVFTSNTNLVREVKNLSLNFKRIEITMFYANDNSLLDCRIHFIVKLTQV